MQVQPLSIVPSPPSLSIFLLMSCVGVGIFVLSGVLVTLPLFKRGYITRDYFLISSILASCLVGYAMYWVYFLNIGLGKIVSVVIYILCLFLLSTFLVKLYRHRLTVSEISLAKLLLIPIGITLLISTTYNATVFSCAHKNQLKPGSEYCTLIYGTSDSTMPLSFALADYKHIPNPMVGDWLSSDRPPLQSGIEILQLPVASRVGDIQVNYQLLASFLQCLWVVALLEFIKIAKNAQKQLAAILLIATTNIFLFINSVFVWPKLLAGTLTVFGYIITVNCIKKKGFTTQELCLLATALSLGFLSHGGVIFTLFPMLAIGLFLTRKFISIKNAAIFCAVFVAIFLPWALYKSYYQPPGNRLIKWWLAGQVQINNDTSTNSIIKAYRGMSPLEIANRKVNNFVTLTGLKSYDKSVRRLGPQATLQGLDNTYFLPSLSFSLIGLGVAYLGFKRSRLSLKAYYVKNYVASLALTISIISLVFWCLSSFGTKQSATIAYANSYATFLLSLFALLVFAAKFRRLINVLAIVSTVYFLTLAVIAATGVHRHLYMTYVLVALLGFIITVLLFFRSHLLEATFLSGTYSKKD